MWSDIYIWIFVITLFSCLNTFCLSLFLKEENPNFHLSLSPNSQKIKCLLQANAEKWIWWNCNFSEFIWIKVYFFLCSVLYFFFWVFLVSWVWLMWTRMMSDYKVEMINDGMQEFYVEFNGPKESKFINAAFSSFFFFYHLFVTFLWLILLCLMF